MGLRVITFCSYCTDPPFTRQDTFHAGKFIKAIKGDGVKGWGEIPVPIGGQRRRLESQNCGDVFGWFGEMAASHCPSSPRPVLVPIPGCKAISEAEVRAGVTYRLARSLADRLHIEVDPVLHWERPMLSARQGGPRDPDVLFANLVVERKPNGSVVLIDDVCTSGGHLQAADAGVRLVGCEVRLAICAGQADSVEQEDAFIVRGRELETFNP